MRTMKLGCSDLEAPVIAVGCMRLKTLALPDADRFIKTAIDNGANFFDHADVYSSGECESLFAEAVGMNSSVREKVMLQSKCGIIKGEPKVYDFSKEHILSSVDGSLKRLKTDYLDVLLLHRPDALMEPEEVAEAFDVLQNSGKVRHFGVSNHNPLQIQLLRKAVKQPIVANQLQLGPAFTPMLSAGLHVNMLEDASVNRDGSVLDFCRLHDITIQPWSPFQFGMLEGVFLGSDKFPQLNATIDAIGAKYGVAATTITMAWLLRHPARLMPIAGTMNAGRLLDCIKAVNIALTRKEWYAIYMAAGNSMP